MVSAWLRGLALCWLGLGLVWADEGQNERFEFEQSWPAQERIERAIELPQIGRYAVLAEGEQAVDVQLVDRMTGPSGRSPGRVDVIAAAGPIKVILHSQQETTGEMTLQVRRFEELHQGELPQLPELRLLEAELADFQQRSWWLVIDEPRYVSIEMAGRYLAELRLWRDGEWLSGVEAQADEITPESGQPLQRRHIHARLERGLYRLVAYGGPGTPWAEQSDASPLYVRSGVAEMPAWGWWQYQTSPFGVDRWLIRSAANLFQLQLAQAQEAEISVAPYSRQTSPLRQSGHTARIDKESRTPEAVINHNPGRDQLRLVTVRYRPGESYRLSALHHATQYSIESKGNGRQSIGVVGLSDPRDSVDATVIAFDSQDWRRGEQQPLAEQMPVLDSSNGWAGRFNLLRDVELLIRVAEEGDYVAELAPGSEAMAEFRLQPILSNAPSTMGSNWQFGSSHQWMLTKGLYRLSIRPAAGHPGIAEVRLRHDELPAEDVPVSDNIRDGADLAPVQAGRYRVIHLNDFDHGGGGLMLRDLPLSLDQALPVTHQDDELRSFDVVGGEGRRLQALRPDRTPMAMAFSRDGPWQDSLVLEGGGERRVWVRNDAEHAVIYNLHWQPDGDGILSLQDLPRLDQAVQEMVNQPLPRIEPDKPILLDLARNSASSHRLLVETPALYRLESTGLLDTHGEMRDRIRLDLASSAGGGSGRNFLIQHYLGEGEYRLVTRSRGQSAGPLGLSVSRAPERDAGELPVDTPARTTVAADEAVAYRLQVEQAGRYRIHARGLAGGFAIQLDGPDGWPVLRPGSQTPLTVELQAGEHRLMVLPDGLVARAVTSVEPIGQNKDRTVEGHGPHTVALNSRYANQWRESDARTPDDWRFELPDSMHVRLDPGSEMQPELERRENGRWQAVSVPRAGQWNELPAGHYRALLRAKRVDDRRDYQLTVRSRELPPGQQRSVPLPAEIALSLDQDALVQLSSLSRVDLQAELRDADGQRVAFSDHRPDDWNFLISRQLAAGRYSLHVSAVGGGTGQAVVAHDQPDLQTAGLIGPGAVLDVSGGQGRSYPLRLPEAIPDQGYPLVYASLSAATHGVSLERNDGQGWLVVHDSTGRSNRGGVVLQAADRDADYRLRVWPLDDVAQPLRLALPEPPADLHSADRRQTPVELGDSGIALIGLRLDEAGMARMRNGDSTSSPQWQWASSHGAFRPVREHWLPADGDVIWLLGEADAPDFSVGTVALERQASLSLPIGMPGRLLVAPAQDELRLWQVNSVLTQPSVMAEGDGQATGWALLPGGAGGSAVAVALPGQTVPALRLRRADGEPEEKTMQLSEHRLTVQAHGEFSSDSRRITVPAGQAARLQLSGSPGLKLAMPAQMAVASSRGEQYLEQLQWSGDRPRSLHFDVRGDTLWLLNPGETESVVHLARHQLRLIEDAPWLAAGQAGFHGMHMLDIPAPETEQVIDMGGDIASLWLLDDAGRLHEPQNGQVRITTASRLLIEHGDEPFALWRGDDRQIPSNAERFTAREQHSVSLTASEAGLMRLIDAEGRHALTWMQAGESRHRLLPAGDYQVLLQPARSGAAGVAPQIAHHPLIAIDEGLNPTSRLGPGQSQGFVFELADEQTIGLGLQAEREVLQMQLIDAAGDVLGEGVVQMHENLPAGRYLLLVHLASDEAPVAFRPALVGTETPDDLIPDAVRQRLTER